MPTAIVTGSGGLIGSESVRHFVEAGYDVIGHRERHAGAVLRARRVDARTSASALVERYRRVPLARARHPRRRRRRAACSREHAPELELVVHTAAQPSHDWAASRSADRLRRQRQRHAQPARGRAPARPGRDVRLLLDEQGLRRHARTRCRSSSTSTRLELPEDHRVVRRHRHVDVDRRTRRTRCSASRRRPPT